MKSFISVVMPVYNGEKYLHEAIDSILTQTYNNFEFIIINDGSSDGTEEIILSYDDSRIKYVKNEKNLQIVKTLNKGISLARGEYIARMDADDISFPQRFQKQLAFLEKNKDIAICGAQIRYLDENSIKGKSKRFPQEHAKILSALLINSPLAHPVVMIRCELFSHYKYDERFNRAEDYALWVKVADTHKFHNLPNELLLYRMHSKQTDNKAQIIIANQIRREIIQQVCIHSLSNDQIEAYCKVVAFDSELSIIAANKILCEILSQNKISKVLDEKILTKQFGGLLWQFSKHKKVKNLVLFREYNRASLSNNIRLPFPIYLKFFIRCLFNVKE